MSDPLHAPTTAALELARSGMSIGDAVDSIRARFDLTDALVIDVACRVDTALTNEAKAREREDLAKAVAAAPKLEDAAREHEPGLVDAERVGDATDRLAASMRADRLAEAEATVAELRALIAERSEKASAELIAQGAEIARLRELASGRNARLAFVEIAARIMWTTLSSIASDVPCELQSMANEAVRRVSNLRVAQGMDQRVLEGPARIVLELGGRTFELTDPTPGGYFSISREQLDACRIGTEALDAAIARAQREQLEQVEIAHRAESARARVARAFEATGLRATNPRIDLAIEAAHGVLQVADAARLGYLEHARDHADDLACVLAALLGSLAPNLRAASPRTDREDA